MKEVKCVKECISKAKADFESDEEELLGVGTVERNGKCVYRVTYNNIGFDLVHYDTLILVLDKPYRENTPLIGSGTYSRTDCIAINTALTWAGVGDKYEVHIKDDEVVLWTWI